MRCEFGYCVVCDKEIAQKCDSCNSKKPNGQYTEVQVEWSNGSKMQIAVCLDCAGTHRWNTPESKEGITKAHQDHWEKMGGTFDPEIVIV